MASSNSNPSPSLSGVNSIHTSPYWPLPPDWRTNLPWALACLVNASRYETCGLPTVTSAWNSRRRRSTMMSKCNSPIPAINVSPVSGLVSALKVGSSSASFWSPLSILSWSALDLGSTETWITGSGKSIDSSWSGLSGSVKESPVVVFFKPIAAAISPENTSGISCCWLECIWSKRPTRSRLPLVALRTYEPDWSEPV